MIHFTDCPDEKEFLEEVRINGLLRYNMEKTGGRLKQPDMEITRVARDENGLIVGGAQGFTYLNSLEIEVLWVKESHRGQSIASGLLAEVEDAARKAGCRLAHLATYSFQAPLFYQKQGYSVCGELSGFPDDIILYWLKKSL